MVTKSILFQLVHPAKYFFHRETINALISEGHHIDIIVQNKDVLLDLVSKEKWNSFNLFPDGRKIQWLPKKISYVVAFFLSFLVMLNFTRKKKYDLFVGGELVIQKQRIYISLCYSKSFTKTIEIQFIHIFNENR